MQSNLHCKSTPRKQNSQLQCRTSNTHSNTNLELLVTIHDRVVLSNSYREIKSLSSAWNIGRFKTGFIFSTQTSGTDIEIDLLPLNKQNQINTYLLFGSDFCCKAVSASLFPDNVHHHLMEEDWYSCACAIGLRHCKLHYMNSTETNLSNDRRLNMNKILGMEYRTL